MLEPIRHFDFIKGEVLFFDKELDWTSFDLVQKVRNSLCRKMGIKKLKVGHAGTLDPKATGLMILCTGKATKQIESIQGEEKEYIAELKIGATTPSYDTESEEDNIFDYSHVTEEVLKEALKAFIGEINQVPPIFSAVKVKGIRAYEFARKGNDPKLKPKKVVIESIEVLDFNPPKIGLKVVCGKGTYIRSLARDIGKTLNCGAYLVGLRRTRIGEYEVGQAMSVNYFLTNLDSFVTN
ncbi:MAG: tRNA pseudouridine(55) synthase TruB [Chlorobi bacterium]|nr:tRNA pseudouridine(55) synthase TruB [Chlorobiota bacterium]